MGLLPTRDVNSKAKIIRSGRCSTYSETKKSIYFNCFWQYMYMYVSTVYNVLTVYLLFTVYSGGIVFNENK